MTGATPDHKARDKAAYVALQQPLPCLLVYAQGSCGDHDDMNQVDTAPEQGFLHAVASSGLLIERLQRTSPPKKLTLRSVRIALRSDLHYHLEIDALDFAAPYEEAVITDPKSLAALADLMTVLRKSQHIQICEHLDVEATDRYTGFTDLTLLPKALPELAWDELDTTQSFLGRCFDYPFLITGMTGGLRQGAEINLRLARAAAQFGIPMGVGSQRIALENPAHAAIFAVKRHVPNVFLIGNLGAAQLIAGNKQQAIDWCRRAVEQIEADALALHVNVLQEVIQVEGDRDFRGLLERIGAVVDALPVPVVVKEVGCGLDPDTVLQLIAHGVRVVDVGGKGGTSWSMIEGERARSEVTRSIGASFRDWGIPTAVAALTLCRRFPELEVIATGGIRDGLTVAKAIALGPRMVGIGLPLLRAALRSEEAPLEVLETLARGLKTAMIASGCSKLTHLCHRLRANTSFLEQVGLYDQDQQSGYSPFFERH